VALLHEDAVMRMPPQPSLIGALQIARFFREVGGGGTLAQFRLAPTRANGRPAVAIYHRDEERGWVPHGISVLEIDDGRIAGIDSFIKPALLPRFGFAADA
jgi:RNA polymerase sigma-70 factor, ECF subfamily